MSFILKALKKLEHEKAARRSARVEISSALLEPEKRSHRSERAFSYWFKVSLLFVAAAGIVLFIRLKGPSTVAVPRPSPSFPVQAAPSMPTAAPASREERPVLPAAPVARGEAPLPDEPVMHPGKTPLEDNGQTRRFKRKTAGEPSAPRPVKASQTEAEPPLATAPSTLIVNGIALQDDPARSIAVVNGQIVKKGMSVGDARIERIFLDRVRFRGGSGIFEVPLAR